MNYKTIAIAGTFDRLHKGHRFFISQAFILGEKVIIGLTSDRYVLEKLKIKNFPASAGSRKRREKLKIQVDNYKERETALRDFLSEEGLLSRAEIVRLEDVYGPAILPAQVGKDGSIQALVVTSETIKGARLVNIKRRELGLPPLKILKIPLVLAQNKRRIASTRIRLGEIDRWGRVYKLKIPASPAGRKNEKLKIEEKIRIELKKPLGILIKGGPQDPKQVVPRLKKIVEEIQPTMIITVGDEVTKLGNEISLPIGLAIVDYKVRRVKIYNSLSDLGFRKAFARPGLANAVVVVRNPAGYIKRSLVEAVKRSFNHYCQDGRVRVIRVIGEEDLAGVPAILLAPLGSIVLYGQPEEGVVVVEVTERKKEELSQLLRSVDG